MMFTLMFFDCISSTKNLKWYNRKPFLNLLKYVLSFSPGDPGGHRPETLLLQIGKVQLAHCREILRRNGCRVHTTLWVSTQFGLGKSVDVVADSTKSDTTNNWRPRKREDDFFSVLRSNKEELEKTGLAGI